MTTMPRLSQSHRDCSVFCLFPHGGNILGAKFLGGNPDEAGHHSDNFSLKSNSYIHAVFGGSIMACNGVIW